MDVVWGETAGVEGQLLLLCPILFVLQVSGTFSTRNISFSLICVLN